MANLTLRTNQVFIVLNYKDAKDVEPLTRGLTLYLTMSGYRYAFITHDKDMKEDNTPKAIHTHLLIDSPKPHQLAYYLNRLQDLGWDANQISIEPVNSLPYAYQYLTHKNDLSKVKYERSLVRSNYSLDKQNELYNLEALDSLTFDTLMKVVKNSSSMVDVASQIGLKAFKENYYLLRELKNEGYFNKDNRRAKMLNDYGIVEKE